MVPGARLRPAAASALAIVLAACAGGAPAEQPPAVPFDAVTAGIVPGPPIRSLTLEGGRAEAARLSFIESCPKLLAHQDKSGIEGFWTPACEAAPLWAADPPGFFAAYFETGVVGGGEGFITGYFEPQIAGVREEAAGFDVPVFGLPVDLIRQPGYSGEGRAPLGRIDETDVFVPYFDRAEIEGGALNARAPVIGWARDPVEFFFLQIQGSGQLVAPDGSVLRIGYAGQNGREYVAIGRVLRERGVFQPGEATMQKIVGWLHAHPEDGRAVMRENKSWVFFRELAGDAPLGALEVPVRPRVSAAADPRFVPLGAPVWIDAERDEADGLWIAQDTGGAIKGANRLDTFWGAGEDARRIAGGLSSSARVLLFLPKGTLVRLAAR